MNNDKSKKRNNIHHFTSVGALQSIIKSNSLRLTNSMYMNDRNEFTDFLYSMVNTTEKLCRTEVGSNKAIFDCLCKRYKEELEEHLSDEDEYSHLAYFVFSTCSNSESVPMWNYYSDSAGICIEFDYKKLMKFFKVSIQDTTYEFKEYGCLYNAQEKHEILKECICASLDELAKKEIGDFQYSRFWNAMLRYSYMFKDQIFEYENERRFILCCPGAHCSDDEEIVPNNIRFDFYNTNETIRPCVHVKSKSILPIKSIYVSPFNHNETTVRGIKLMLNYYGYEDVVVKRMNMTIRNKY